MKASIVPIGNSKGIRIPKPVLEQCNIGDEVDMEVVRGRIIIMPSKKKPRAGWAEAFRKMHGRGEDKLVIDDTIDLDLGDWVW